MDEQLTFSQYLQQKKINAEAFRRNEREKYDELDRDFAEMHPDSFTAHYLFLINPLRRKYLMDTAMEVGQEKPKGAPRPKVLPKVK